MSWDRPELTTATTAMLSQWHSTSRPPQCSPHIATAKRIGRSSFGEIGHSIDGPSHFHCNHHDPQWAPQPQEPEASVSSGMAGIETFGTMETPFHLSIKTNHQFRSERVDELRRIHRSCVCTVETSSIKRRTNVRPGRTTVAACCKCPKRDSRSLFLHAFLPSQSLTKDRVRCNLSSGNLITI